MKIYNSTYYVSDDIRRYAEIAKKVSVVAAEAAGCQIYRPNVERITVTYTPRPSVQACSEYTGRGIAITLNLPTKSNWHSSDLEALGNSLNTSSISTTNAWLVLENMLWAVLRGQSYYASRQVAKFLNDHSGFLESLVDKNEIYFRMLPRADPIERKEAMLYRQETRVQFSLAKANRLERKAEMYEEWAESDRKKAAKYAERAQKQLDKLTKMGGHVDAD